ncbi:MAG: sigma-70 family RNA polymerase sigma factor [Saprospiraceae bacterium]|nr:sigma-70 family RNA polymerase sigma factor [Saprospiraceae bacterium]
MPSSSEHTELIKRALVQDQMAQKALFAQYYGYVMSLTLRYMGSREEAEEMLNDVFIKVFDRLRQYNENYPFEGWLRKIAIHTCIDRIRSLRKLPVLSDLTSLLHTTSDEQDFIWDKEVDILPILQELPPKYRAVFNLYVFDEYKHREIAKILGISEGTSKSNYSRAKAILKKRLSREVNEKSARQMAYSLKSQRL